MSKIAVSSEIAPLRRVIVHRPDLGIARVSPRLAEELLFDDIVFLPHMQREHDVFLQVLKAFVGDNGVLTTEQLLLEALDNDEDAKQDVIGKIIDFEELPNNTYDLLMGLSHDRLVQVLITGYLERDDHFLFHPIPNFIFTRDIAVTLRDHVLITKPAKLARARENFLTRFIFWAHPIFSHLRQQDRLINLNNVNSFPPSRSGEKISLEGGDVMVINDNYLLIGCSERTTEHAIHSLRDEIFRRKLFDHLVQINIPQDRSFMHIDTIFTQINTHDVVAFPPIIIDGLSSYVQVYHRGGPQRYYPSVAEFWQKELDPQVRFIRSGRGISPYMEREQWTDGCNLVAMRPGVALTYDRNPVTEEAFRQAGYTVISAAQFLAKAQRPGWSPDQVTDTIITLPSSELSRARGGSHCMTCPIERA